MNEIHQKDLEYLRKLCFRLLESENISKEDSISFVLDFVNHSLDPRVHEPWDIEYGDNVVSSSQDSLIHSDEGYFSEHNSDVYS